MSSKSKGSARSIVDRHLLRPVLVIAGEGDVLLPPENSRLIAERVPGAELAIVAGSLSAYLWTRFESFAPVIETRTTAVFVDRGGKAN